MYLLSRINALNHIKVAANLLKHIKTNQLRHIYNATPVVRADHKSKIVKESTTGTRIYYFPLIRVAAILNRFKLYQTAFVVASIPLSVVMFHYGVVELNYIGFITGGASFACIMLYLMTGYFRRLIGIISISEDDKTVKISHLTFWGRKNDIIVPVNDIIPLSDGDCNPNDAFVKVQRYSSSDYLYLTLKHGKVLEKTKFELVFGSLDVIGFRK